MFDRLTVSPYTSVSRSIGATATSSKSRLRGSKPSPGGSTVSLPYCGRSGSVSASGSDPRP